MFILSYSEFRKNNSIHENYLSEAVSSNTKGVMHELLTGYYLNNEKHMERHADINGDSPQEAHDKLKARMTPDEYDHISARAKSAAADIKKRLGIRKIHKVSWTSKPGDLERSTGIGASQKDDASDIVVTTKDRTHKSGFRHHGISLKATDNKPSAGEMPVSNPGLESTYGGKEILNDHREKLQKAYPALKKAANKAERKEFLAKNPEIDSEIKKKNSEVLNDITQNMHSKLSKMKPTELANHIRNHVLHAHPTPMQRQGHIHLRHTSYGDGSHSGIDPAQEHEHILSTPQHITVERGGTSVVFSHKGQPFARHRIKFESQSDPLSSVKGSGEIIKNKNK